MFGIRQIDKMHQQDILLENEPFPLWGRMIPSYEKEKWSYSIVKFGRQDTGEMCFPNENYDFDSMSRNSTFIGAYDNGKCIGLAILRDGFFRYWYLYDLKVKQDYRRQGAASMLIEKAKELAAKKGYLGIYTQAQDNNLSACLFYLNNGFRIGGLDTEIYNGTSQEGKADILFYLDLLPRGGFVPSVAAVEKDPVP